MSSTGRKEPRPSVVCFYSIGGDLNGVIICVDKLGRIGHVAVQHPKGTYDGGYFEGIQDYEFKPRKGESGKFQSPALKQCP